MGHNVVANGRKTYKRARVDNRIRDVSNCYIILALQVSTKQPNNGMGVAGFQIGEMKVLDFPAQMLVRRSR